MRFSVCFTNYGPYHRARLRALAGALERRGDRLIAYEVASSERTYPWSRGQRAEPFEWATFFPRTVLETVPAADCRNAMIAALERDRPDVVGVVGYVRPESLAALRWANRCGRPAVLMSESQEIDWPRVWWKEAVKRRRVGRFNAALVGGPSHRDYLVKLGMPERAVALGYNAVDHGHFATEAARWARSPAGRDGLPPAPYFLSVSRFSPEKNLVRLVDAFARYRRAAAEHGRSAWDLVLCGDGPNRGEVEAAVAASGAAGAIHRPGFLQVDDLPRWYAHAGAFVLASTIEPWGLVVNEAAACGLPLLVSSRAGAAATLVPAPEGTTGATFDPRDPAEIARKMAWAAGLPDAERQAMGARSAQNAALWGPDRFARGTLEAIELCASQREKRAHDAKARRPAPMSVNG